MVIPRLVLLHALLIHVQGFRIHAESEASSKYPVVFIARERTGGILSFGLPLQPEGYKFLPLFLLILLVTDVFTDALMITA